MKLDRNNRKQSGLRHKLRGGGASALLVLAVAGIGEASAAAASAPEILRSKCGTCHLENGALQRIGNLRKSPEGWDMTIARMGVWHKVEVSRDERKALVKYLADRQGLAPEESAPYRYLLERRPNAQDVVPNEEFAQMCGRCHSFGRVALQRRDAGEWQKLVHTHLGQFPSIEYSALGRDRNWRELALGQTAPQLAEHYPLRSAAWKDWQARQASKPAGAAGSWRVVGNRPGWGDYAGTMRVTARGGDRYDVDYEFAYAAGSRVSGRGEAILYTGYEWRGDATLGNQPVRSVFALSKDGSRLAGRWFLRNATEIGASFEAVRDEAKQRGRILAVQPALLKAGGPATVSVHGVRLGKDVDLGPGIRVLAAEQVSPHEVKLQLDVAADAAAGWRAVRAGAGRGEGRVAVYSRIDSVRVEPPFAYARHGGGTTTPESAQFEAIAYLDGADGKPGTDDDTRLGAVPASWTVDNFDDKAKAAEDAKFAGIMAPHGQFIPAFAGPNPARKGLNNVGDLSVVASVRDGERTLDAGGRLMVVVQRWNTPPLR
ncbi:MAG: quinohemoprotein amine dehydrogenase subunit alpha [Rhodocyclales bacterium]|nr:quinohemoprotein amine dehydrogenase subunit alpha [Rhodocyclales bacterium]